MGTGMAWGGIGTAVGRSALRQSEQRLKRLQRSTEVEERAGLGLEPGCHSWSGAGLRLQQRASVPPPPGPQSALNPSSGSFDERRCAALSHRYVALMERLKPLGYNPAVHPALAESLVNTYGILRELPEPPGPPPGPAVLRHAVLAALPPALRADALVLLECLRELAREDGKPLFLA